MKNVPRIFRTRTETKAAPAGRARLSRLAGGQDFRSLATGRVGYVVEPDKGKGAVTVMFEDGSEKILHPNVMVEAL